MNNQKNKLYSFSKSLAIKSSTAQAFYINQLGLPTSSLTNIRFNTLFLNQLRAHKMLLFATNEHFGGNTLHTQTFFSGNRLSAPEGGDRRSRQSSTFKLGVVSQNNDGKTQLNIIRKIISPHGYLKTFKNLNIGMDSRLALPLLPGSNRNVSPLDDTTLDTKGSAEPIAPVGSGLQTDVSASGICSRREQKAKPFQDTTLHAEGMEDRALHDLDNQKYYSFTTNQTITKTTHKQHISKVNHNTNLKTKFFLNKIYQKTPRIALQPLNKGHTLNKTFRKTYFLRSNNFRPLAAIGKADQPQSVLGVLSNNAIKKVHKPTQSIQPVGISGQPTKALAPKGQRVTGRYNPSLAAYSYILKQNKKIKQNELFHSSYSKMTEINLITISLASATRIRQWAEKTLPNGKVVGEVINPETVHYKTLKPIKGGLFCERIFGPLKDHECACGKKFNIKNYLKTTQGLNSLKKGNSVTGQTSFFGEVGKLQKRYFCRICDVEYTYSIIRRTQLGYIQLASPTTHVWFVKGIPSYISILLDMKKKHLQNVTYNSETLTLEHSFRGRQFLPSSPSSIFESWQKIMKSQYPEKYGATESPNSSKKDIITIAANSRSHSKPLPTGAINPSASAPGESKGLRHPPRPSAPFGGNRRSKMDSAASENILQLKSGPNSYVSLTPKLLYKQNKKVYYAKKQTCRPHKQNFDLLKEPTLLTSMGFTSPSRPRTTKVRRSAIAPEGGRSAIPIAAGGSTIAPEESGSRQNQLHGLRPNTTGSPMKKKGWYKLASNFLQIKQKSENDLYPYYLRPIDAESSRAMVDPTAAISGGVLADRCLQNKNIYVSKQSTLQFLIFLLIKEYNSTIHPKFLAKMFKSIPNYMRAVLNFCLNNSFITSTNSAAFYKQEILNILRMKINIASLKAIHNQDVTDFYRYNPLYLLFKSKTQFALDFLRSLALKSPPTESSFNHASTQNSKTTPGFADMKAARKGKPETKIRSKKRLGWKNSSQTLVVKLPFRRFCFTCNYISQIFNTTPAISKTHQVIRKALPIRDGYANVSAPEGGDCRSIGQPLSRVNNSLDGLRPLGFTLALKLHSLSSSSNKYRDPLYFSQQLLSYSIFKAWKILVKLSSNASYLLESFHVRKQELLDPRANINIVGSRNKSIRHGLFVTDKGRYGHLVGMGAPINYREGTLNTILTSLNAILKNTSSVFADNLHTLTNSTIFKKHILETLLNTILKKNSSLTTKLSIPNGHNGHNLLLSSESGKADLLPSGWAVPIATAPYGSSGRAIRDPLQYSILMKSLKSFNLNNFEKQTTKLALILLLNLTTPWSNIEDPKRCEKYMSTNNILIFNKIKKTKQTKILRQLYIWWHFIKQKLNINGKEADLFKLSIDRSKVKTSKILIRYFYFIKPTNKSIVYKLYKSLIEDFKRTKKTHVKKLFVLKTFLNYTNIGKKQYSSNLNLKLVSNHYLSNTKIDDRAHHDAAGGSRQRTDLFKLSFNRSKVRNVLCSLHGIYHNYDITFDIQNRAHLVNSSLIFGKIHNLQYKMFVTDFVQNESKHLQAGQVSIINNIYCLSHRELWEQDKDWQDFAYYYYSPTNITDKTIPLYKNRNFDLLFNMDDTFASTAGDYFPTLTIASIAGVNINTSFSGAGLIQKLLNEFNYTELKKMDKQNRILLFEYNKYVKKLKNIMFVTTHQGWVQLKAADNVRRLKIGQNRQTKSRVDYYKACHIRDVLIRRTKLTRKIFNSIGLQVRKTLQDLRLPPKGADRQSILLPENGQSPSPPSGAAAGDNKYITESRQIVETNGLNMILTLLPVLPPVLRPVLKMSGQFTISDLNRLYQRIIYRNERLKKFLKDPALSSSFEMKYAQRLLQESIDNLIHNGKSGVVPEKDARGRLLKSLSDILKGKQGRFRQYLLGKRVDYSGRSVIVVGPRLKIHECGIPKEMALVLYSPFLIKRILNQKLADTYLSAKKLIKTNPLLVSQLLREIMKSCPVLLNRAPTLHRLGFQAFQPKLVDGKAILLHPLVCPAFNADFDGDQMAVHVPITFEARAEAWKLMLARNNLLSPATGDPIILPSQDMVLGCYYLTTNCAEKWSKFKKGSGLYFHSINDVLKAYNLQLIHIHAVIWVNIKGQIENGNALEQPLEMRIPVTQYKINNRYCSNLQTEVSALGICSLQEQRAKTPPFENVTDPEAQYEQNVHDASGIDAQAHHVQEIYTISKNQLHYSEIYSKTHNFLILKQYMSSPSASLPEFSLVFRCPASVDLSQADRIADTYDRSTYRDRTLHVTIITNQIIKTTPGKILFNIIIKNAIEKRPALLSKYSSNTGLIKNKLINSFELQTTNFFKRKKLSKN
jgi:DNA-directed RNA polymerase subunit beta'